MRPLRLYPPLGAGDDVELLTTKCSMEEKVDSCLNGAAGPNLRPVFRSERKPPRGLLAEFVVTRSPSSRDDSSLVYHCLKQRLWQYVRIGLDELVHKAGRLPRQGMVLQDGIAGSRPQANAHAEATNKMAVHSREPS